MRVRSALLAATLGLWLLTPAWALRVTCSPADGEKVRSTGQPISVRLPFGANLPYRDAQMWIDGQEVSDKLQKTASFLSFQPSTGWKPGAHTVKIKLGDEELAWSFEVESPHLITGVRWNGPKVLHEYDEVHFEVQGLRGLTGSIQIVGADKPVALHEENPGVYRGTFSVPIEFKRLQSPVTVTLKHKDFEDTQTCNEQLKFSPAGFRVALLSPDPAQPIMGDLVLEGRTRPDSQVDLSGQFASASGIDVVSGSKENWDKPFKSKLTAGPDGYFKLTIPRPDVRGRLVLKVSLQAKGKDESTSEVASSIFMVEEKPRFNQGIPKTGVPANWNPNRTGGDPNGGFIPR